LQGRLPDVSARNRKIAVKFLGCAMDRIGQASDKVGTRGFLVVDGLFELVSCLRGDIFGGVDEFRRLIFDCSFLPALEAKDGPSAFAILKSSSRIDIMITDVGLPGRLNGLRIADPARILHPRI
jgi:hypothetical protein